MQRRRWARLAVVVAVMMVSGASAVEAQVATFSQINDAVPGRFFDPDPKATADTGTGKLIVGLHTGMDWTTYKVRDFKASTAAFSYRTATDTISFLVEAPLGYYVSELTYYQTGSGFNGGTGKASGAASWVVAGWAIDLGTFATSPIRSSTVDLTGYNLTSVPVSITNSLFAYATPSLGSAVVTITYVEVVAKVLPLEVIEQPVPVSDESVPVTEPTPPAP